MGFESPLVDHDYLGDFDVSAKIEEHYNYSRTGERSEMEKNWRVNSNWFGGQPFWRRNERGEIEWIKPENRRDYIHYEVIHPRVETLVGHLLYRPHFEARHGAATDLEDRFRARTAAAVANHLVQVSGMMGALRYMHTLVHVYGTAWGKIGWDPMAGSRKPVWGQVPCPTCQGQSAIMSPVDGQIAPCPRCAAQGVINAPPQLGPPAPGHLHQVVGDQPEGEVFLDAIPPWEVYPDPEAPDLFQCQWLVHSRDMPRDKAWIQFCQGPEGPVIAAKDLKDNSRGSQLDQMFGTQLSGAFRRPSKRDYLHVMEYFHVPTSAHPYGVQAVKIGGDLISAGPLRIGHGRIPLVPMRCHVIPGVLYPQSTVDRVLPAAIAINDHWTIYHTRNQQDSTMRILTARGQHVRLSDEHGILEYEHQRGLPEPKELKIGSAPGITEIIDRLMKHADDVTFVSDVMRGGAATESARHDALLEERSLKPLQKIVEDNADSIEKMGRMLLDTAKVFYGDDRTIDVLGTRGHTQVRQYKLADTGSPKDILLVPVRDLLRSTASRREELARLQEAGVFDNPMALKLSELATEGMVYEERRAHESVAMLENELVREGKQMWAPQRRQRHDVHIETHQALADEFTMTFGPDHPAVQMVLQHCEMHDQMQAAEEAQKQMYMAQAAAGYGMANAADGGAQPQQAVQGADAAGMLPPPQSEPGAPSEPGQPETQPNLQAVDAEFTGA